MVRSLIQQTGAERNGHFKIGEYHSRSWISDELMLAKAQQLWNLCRYLAQQMLLRVNPAPEAVVGLAPDGIALVQPIGAAIAAQYMNLPGWQDRAGNFDSLYADEQYQFLPEYEHLLAKREVIVVQTVIYTGKVTGRLIEAIQARGGHVGAVGAIITRGRATRPAIGDVPVIALYDYSVEDALADDCDLCKAGVPITDPKTMRLKQ